MGLLDGLIASLPDAKGSAPSAKSSAGGSGEIESLLRNKAAEYDIDPDLFVSLAKRESGLRPGVKNPGSTAGGLFQFIGGTWDRYGNNKDKFDPEANADAAARMMRDHLGMFKGDYSKALAAHHVGSGKAAKALTDRGVGDKDVSTQQWLSDIFKGAGRDNPLAKPLGAFADAEAGVGGYDQIRRGQIAQAESDESPVSTSLKRGMKGLTHSAGLAVDNMLGDSEGAAQRIIDKQAFDQANPAPSSVQKFGRDWDALAEDDYSGMFGTILKNPAGSFNMMLEQTPNSLPGMTFQTIAGVAGRGLMAFGPVGAAAGLALQSAAALAGNFLPEGGTFLEDELHKSGVDTNDVRAMTKWIEEHRGENFKGGATKAGVISAVDGVTGWMGMKMLAGPSVRFAKAEKDFFAKNGVNVADSAALQAARAGDAYKAAMQPFAADLVKASEGFGMFKRGVGATALDAMGEGVGEYAGSYAATGDASIKDAVLEGVMGVGQGAAMAGAGYGIGKLSGPDQAMEELRKLATANIAPAEAKPNSPLSNAAQAAQSADPITEALKPISERFADRTLYDQISSHPNLGPDAMNQILSAYQVATNTNMDPMARQAAVERLVEFFRLFDNQPNFTMGTGESAPEQASKPGALLSGPDGAESESQPPLIDPLSGRLIGGPSAPALMAPAEEDIAAKRAALLDRVLATNPENPNRTFDRALRLEGFRDSAFTDAEKERIAQFAAMRSSPMSANGLTPMPSQGRYQHLSDMLDAGWESADRGRLVGPNGETYNLKGAGEAQFVRNKLNQKAGNGSQSVRNDPQSRGAQGDLGARSAGVDGVVSDGDGTGLAGSGQDQNTATPDGAVQSAEVAGNGGASNGDVAASRQWLSEEDELNAWFGNSLVVGPDGRPLTVYHTTYKVMDEAISEFDRNHLTKIDPATGRRRKSPSLDSVGVWFSNNPAKTDAYGEGAQYPAHLKITRPVIYRTFDDLLNDWNNFHAKGFADPKLADLHNKQNEFFGDADGFVANLKQRGFDGLIILPHERVASGEDMGSTEFKDQTAYIVFDGSQIRSVFDRRQGEFVAAESEQVAQEAQETNDAQAEQASAAAPETEGLAAQDGNNPAITKPENARRNIIANGGVVEETQAINNVEYPELPGIAFFTRQTPDGKFNVVDERSGYAVFIGAPSEAEAINNFRARVGELGINNVRARLESQKAIDAPKRDGVQNQGESDFEHAGYKIYRSRVNVAGEAKDYWAVQAEENRQKGKVGFGDTLHETKDQAVAAADRQKKDVEATAEYDKTEQVRRDSEAQAKSDKEADTYNGFLDGKTPAKKGLIRKSLAKEMRINGVVSTLRNYVESSLFSGKLEVSTYEENKIKPMSRTAFNRASQREQDAHEKKVREGGKVTVYEVNGFDLGKTTYDYAQHLLSQQGQSASQQKTDEAPKAAEQAAPESQPENGKPAYADDAELQDALSHLGDVLGDVFGAKLNITGKQYGASDLLPAMSKVIELLIKKGFKSFRESVGAATNAMRGNANTKGFVDQITPRQWKAAYNSVAEFHEGTDSEEDVAKYSAEQIQKIIALPEKIKEAEQATNHDATPGQKEAGNYAKGKFAWHGLNIAVETAKGEDRTDKETGGDKWRVKMPATYGYVLGSEGADGDHVDVFMGDKPESQRVYVINQTKPDSTEFDEHKVMLGYDSEGAAIGDYLLSFTGTFGHSVLGSISGPYSIDDFKSMLESNRLKHAKPTSDRLAYVNPRVEESNQLPPGVRINGAKEKAAAERLAQLLDKMDQVRMDRNTPEGAAKGSIRSAIEELRKERSVGDIPGLLDTAAQRLFRRYSAFSDVASEVAESLRAADKYAETVAKFKAKQESGIALSDIEVDRQSNGTGRIKTYKQRADEALSEIDERMGLGKQLLECLNS